MEDPIGYGTQPKKHHWYALRGPGYRYAVRLYNEPSAYVCGQVGYGNSREGPLEYLGTGMCLSLRAYDPAS
jgi:hypothetical protein